MSAISEFIENLKAHAEAGFEKVYFANDEIIYEAGIGIDSVHFLDEEHEAMFPNDHWATRCMLTTGYDVCHFCLAGIPAEDTIMVFAADK